jgi:hypothetical protein
MGFSFWHWAILFLLIGVPVFFAVRSAIKPSQNPAGLVGFGGWLMLLAIGQALSLLGALVALGSSSDGYQQLMTLPNGTLAVYGEVALLLAFLVLQVVVFVAMLRRSYRFKQLFLYQWFAIPIVFVLDTTWVSAVLGVPVSQVLAGNALVTPVVSFLLTGIWVAYVYKSVRVRNTFTRASTSGQVASAMHGPCRQNAGRPYIDPDQAAGRPARARISGAGVIWACGLL